MKTENDSMGVGLRNIEVGKAECSIVLIPQAPKDRNLLSRLLSEDFVVEPVTLTDDRQEIDGFEEHPKRGWTKGVRLAVRPQVKTSNKPKGGDKPESGAKATTKGS